MLGHQHRGAELLPIPSASATETTAYQRKAARDEATKVLDQLKKAGMVVHELPAEEVAKLREKAKPVIAKYTKDLGEEFVGELYAEIEKVRGKK